jgi:hypothetical protein
MALEDRIRSSVDTALNKVRTQLEQDAQAIADLLISASREDHEQELKALREQSASELHAVREQSASELNTVREQAASELNALRAQAASELEAVRAQLSGELDTVRTQLSSELTATRSQSASEINALRTQSSDELAALRQQSATEAERLVREAKAEVEQRERAADTARISRLLEGIRGLDGARSLSEVLDALGHAASREASRAAVLIIRQERLIGWKLTGFGPQDAQPKAIDIPLADGGVLSTAALSARATATSENRSGVEGPAFADRDPKPIGLAVPVSVGGRVVAVVYADAGNADGLADQATRWPDAVEILARHAGRCLEGLTVQRTVSAASPRFWVQAAGRPGAPATHTTLVDPPPVPAVTAPPGATP